MPLKMEIVHKELPCESPGSWGPSKLKVYMYGDREVIKRVLDAITRALKPEDLK